VVARKEEYRLRYTVEIVHSQMTKPNGGTVTSGGEDRADLDIAIGDNDAVDKEFDERPPLLKGGPMQSVTDLGTKRLERLCDSAQGQVLLRHGVEVALLGQQGLLPTGQLVSLAVKDWQSEDASKIGVEQALLGGVQVGQGVLQCRLARLQLLGQPVPTMRAA